MASTPSASALSAVLRCRGNIWARNPPTKRPATSAYSLGLAGGVVRDCPAERSRTNRASAWEAFLQGERVVVGRRLTVAYKSPRVDVNLLREKDSVETNKSCHLRLWQSSGDALSAAPGVQHALVRQLTRRLTSNLRGVQEVIHMIQHETCAAHLCKTIFVQEISEFPGGALKVSITFPRKVGQTASFTLPGWSTLKSTCLSFTALVSEVMKLVELCRSSSCPDDVPQQDQKHVLQANGQIHNPSELPSTKDSGFGHRITEDRPD